MSSVNSAWADLKYDARDPEHDDPHEGDELPLARPEIQRSGLPKQGGESAIDLRLET